MGLSVLLVEDDQDFKKVVEIRLKAWRSYVAITAANSLENARSILNATPQPFDLVLLDQHLPDGFGWELIKHEKLERSTVLAMSADSSAELPAQTVLAGAQHFLAKRQITEPLFIPLVEALMERKKLERELVESRLKQSKMETIKVLLATLRHEINNPLGAVFGGTYLLRSKGDLAEAQNEALKLIESSSQRIKHVIEQLCQAVELEKVTKAHEEVYQVPGDKPWNSSN